MLLKYFTTEGINFAAISANDSGADLALAEILNTDKAK